VEGDAVKRLILLSAAGLVALAEVLILIFPSLVPYLVDLMPASLPTPPKGFDVHRELVERGSVETVDYDSKAAGCTRKMRVYTPPQFAKDKHYPVLYLLHGSLGDETSWVKDGRADAIFDNLHADKKLVPMIVVMPDVNLPAMPDAGLFDLDLLGDVNSENVFWRSADRSTRRLAILPKEAAMTISDINVPRSRDEAKFIRRGNASRSPTTCPP